MPSKAWRRHPPPPVDFARLLGLPPLQAHLLYNRGIRLPEEVEPYLSADLRLANDPMLLPDMDKAVARLRQALAAGETVGVFGDFDTDGITGTALTAQALQELGSRVIPYLPNRVDEGHGLNAKAVGSLKAQGVSLMLTIDCGSSSNEEVSMASSMGIDTIITDHHALATPFPKTTALVNPKRPDSSYPYEGLTGAGLAFKLVEALSSALGRPRPDHLLELAALGTVADLGPMTGENRYMVRKGLELLNYTQHPGLRALIDRCGLRYGSLDTESMAFGLIPRLNAAGRLGDASLSLALLTAPDSEVARPIAESLEQYNVERRRLSEESVAQAREQVELRSGTPPSLIIVEHPEWLPGILGLIAGQLAERYHRPSVAISVGEDVCRASARSIPEFDMVEALRNHQELFHRFGGHHQAAGFTLSTDDLPRLKAELELTADEKLKGKSLVPSIDIDCEITPELLTEGNLSFILSLGPCGEGNRAPVFLTRNALITEARRVGAQGNHLKMRVAYGDRTWPAIAFRQGERSVVPGERVHLVYTAGFNDWGGKRTVQLTVLDFRRAA